MIYPCSAPRQVPTGGHTGRPYEMRPNQDSPRRSQHGTPKRARSVREVPRGAFNALLPAPPLALVRMQSFSSKSAPRPLPEEVLRRCRRRRLPLEAPRCEDVPNTQNDVPAFARLVSSCTWRARVVHLWKSRRRMQRGAMPRATNVFHGCTSVLHLPGYPTEVLAKGFGPWACAHAARVLSGQRRALKRNGGSSSEPCTVPNQGILWCIDASMHGDDIGRLAPRETFGVLS